MAGPEENNEELKKEETAAEKKARENAEKAQKALEEEMANWKKNSDRMKDIKHIRLTEAKEAIERNLKGEIGWGEFIKKTSGVYGGFWHSLWAKMTMKKNSSCAMNRITEIEKSLEVVKQDKLEQEERQANLEKDIDAREKEKGIETEKDEKVLDESGDLARHEFTGRGYEFQDSKAETLAKLNSEKELKGFKKEVYDKALADLNKRQSELEAAKALKEKTYENLIAANTKPGSELTRDDFDDIKYTRDSLLEVESTINSKDTLDKEDKTRLEEIAKDKARLQSEINDYQLHIDLNDDDYQKGKALHDEAEKRYTQVKLQYDSFKKRFDEVGREFASEEDIELMDQLTATYEKAQKVLDKANASFGKIDIKRQNVEKDIKAREEQIKALEEEERDVNENLKKRAEEDVNLRDKREYLKRRENYLKENIEDYDAILETQRLLAAQEETLKAHARAKENLERDVLNTDVVEFLADNAAHDRIRGMTINGKEYFDEKSLEKQGIKEVPKLEDKDVLRQREMQKIVRALKSRDIFKYVNGKNAGEYATYNSETGKFDLYKGSALDKEGKKAFVDEFRGQYFSDSNEYSNHLVEEHPNAFRAKVLGGALKAAAVGMKDAVIDTIKNIPKKIPEALSNIPVLGDYFIKEDEETYIQAGRERIDEGIQMACNVLAMNDVLSPYGYDVKKMYTEVVQTLAMLKAIKQEIGPEEFNKAMMKMVGDEIGKEFKTFYKDTEFGYAGIGEYVLAIEKSVKGIIKGDFKTKEQQSALKSLLHAGRERMGSIMRHAITQSKIERFDSIVDLSQTILSDTLTVATGLTNQALKLGVSVGAGLTKAIHKAVQEAKTKEELLNNPNILGGINYDKNLISDEAFNRILSDTIGINSKDDLAKTIHTMDAIDLHRAAKATKGKDKDVTRSMYALGFKDVHSWDKVKVEDILKKTTGEEKDIKQELRASTEKEGFHFSSFFKKIWHSIVGTRSGEDKVKRSRREENLYKQNKLLYEKYGHEAVRKADGAKRLYEQYKNDYNLAKLSGKEYGNTIKNPATGKALDPIADREQIIKLFSQTPEAIAVTQRVVGGFGPQHIDKLMHTATTHAAVVYSKELGLNKSEKEFLKEKTAEVKEPVMQEMKIIKEEKNNKGPQLAL